MSESYLQVSPQELKFRFELRKNIHITLTLQNTTKERVAFKVKTTSPKKYCVRPSSGFVEPNATKEVQVIMQAQKEYPPSFADCKDKFLIQSITVPASSELKEVPPELFASANPKDMRQTKLRVLLQGPPKPPSPVPEGVEEPTSPAGVSQYREASEGKASASVASAAAEKADIRKRLDLLEGHSRGGQPTSSSGGSAAVKAGPPAGGFNIFHLFFVALVAFLIGHIANLAVPVLTKLLKGET